jgi:hypothetical protein
MGGHQVNHLATYIGGEGIGEDEEVVVGQPEDGEVAEAGRRLLHLVHRRCQDPAPRLVWQEAQRDEQDGVLATVAEQAQEVVADASDDSRPVNDGQCEIPPSQKD